MIYFTQFIVLCLNFFRVYWGQACTDLLLNYVAVESFDDSLISSLSLWNESGVEHSVSCAVLCNKDKDCVSFFYNTLSRVCTAHAVQFYSGQPRESADLGSRYYTLPIDKRDCADILSNADSPEDGVYVVNPLDAQGHFQVYCDMTTSGGGWTVFQRRRDGSGNFYKNWADYKVGFGVLTGEFWLGNDRISRLTAGGSRLRIDMLDNFGLSGEATYSTFRVESEAYGYRLTATGFSGNRGDSLQDHTGNKFSTYDRDNDNHPSLHIASSWKSGWWFHSYLDSNLNGDYGNAAFSRGLVWKTWHGMDYSLSATGMKLRPY